MATISASSPYQSGPYQSGLARLAAQYGLSLGGNRNDGNYGLSDAARAKFGAMTADEIAGLQADEEHVGNGPVHAILFDTDGEVIGRVYKNGGVAINSDYVGLFGKDFNKVMEQTGGAEKRTAALSKLLGHNGRIFVMTSGGPRLYSDTVELSDEAKKLQEIQRALTILQNLAKHLSDPRAKELLSRVVDFDTMIKAGDNSFVFGTGGNDRVKLRQDSAAFTGSGSDFISGYHGNAVDAGDGDDLVTLRRDAVVNGGGGNDAIRTWSGAKVSGGDGNDVIEVQDNSTVSGDAGDDDISAYSNARIAGGEGNDRIRAYGDAQISGGDGNDDIGAAENAVIDGGSGNDVISAYHNAALDGGEGDDRLQAYSNATLDGGAGDDVIQAHDNATITGGTGDDRIQVNRNATLAYSRGDGNDVVRGDVGRVNFGTGISADQVKVENTGRGILITFAGQEGSIMVRGRVASLTFADGSVLDVAAAVKPSPAPAAAAQGLNIVT